MKRMRVQAVTQLSGQAQDQLVHARDIDRDVRMVVLGGGEERRHQGEVIELALVGELRSAFGPAFEDRAERLNVLTQTRNRRIPLGAITPLDVPFDLRAQSENETPVREPREVPCYLRRRHWAPWKCDSHRRAEREPFRVLRRKRNRKERVASRLGRPYSVEAYLFRGLCGRR